MFAGVRDAVAPAMSELGAALAPLKPAWDAVSSAIGQAWDWIVKLLEPVNMTSAELQGVADKGRIFGQVIGFVMSNGVRQITAVVKAVTWIGQAIGTAAGFLVVNLRQRLGQEVQSIVGAAVEWIMRKVQPRSFRSAARLASAVAGAARWMGYGGELSAALVYLRALLRPARTRLCLHPREVAPRRARRRWPRVAALHRDRLVDAHITCFTQQPGESAEERSRPHHAPAERKAGHQPSRRISRYSLVG